MRKRAKSRVPLKGVPAIAKALDVMLKTMGCMVTPNEDHVVDVVHDRWRHEVPYLGSVTLEEVVALFASSDD